MPNDQSNLVMSIERRVLLSLLEMTKEGPISKTLVSKNARVPLQVGEQLLQKIAHDGLAQLQGKKAAASPNQRVRIAIRAIKLGGDSESACRALKWDEFEAITATAFLVNNFTVKKRFRFKGAGRRWEIDIVGCKEPIIACADCKHWRRGLGRSAAIRVAEAQIERTRALATVHSLHRKLRLTDWRRATLVPMILTLTRPPLKFHRKTPIVPILQLQDFLNELPAYIDTLKNFPLTSQEPSKNLRVEARAKEHASLDEVFK
jgi:hypothetical protein